MGARLIKLDEPGQGSLFKLSDGIVVIGRSRTCDFSIESTSISKQHCQVSRINDFFVVHDLNSRNGTQVNGKRVAEAYLRPGDLVTIGAVRFRFETERGAEAAGRSAGSAAGTGAAPGRSAVGRNTANTVRSDAALAHVASGGEEDAAGEAEPADPAAATGCTSGMPSVDALLRIVESLRSREERGRFADHTRRVGEAALELARELALSEADRTCLRLAALLHDVGVPSDSAVFGAAPELDARSREEVRGHPARGAELARRCGCPESVVAAVRHHHERLDGTGYPDALRGTHIPRLAQVLAVAEAMVGMSSDRAHRPRRLAGEIEEELRAGAGVRYAADVAEAALRVLDRLLEQPTV